MRTSLFNIIVVTYNNIIVKYFTLVRFPNNAKNLTKLHEHILSLG